MVNSEKALKISVIVPIYNTDKYLEPCIQSVLNQTYANWELILIDDGSSDSSGTIADKYELTDERIKVVHKPNEGVSAARNQGIDMSSGDYIAFLDSDDVLTENCLEMLLEAAVNHDADIVAGRICGGLAVSEDVIWSKDEGLKNSLMDNPLTYSACAKLFKTEFVGATRFKPDLRVSEDTYFVFQLLCRQPFFVGIKDSVYVYNENPRSATRAPFSDKFLDVLRVAELKYEIIKANFPEMLDLAENMRLKANMSLLRVLAVKTQNEYHDLEDILLLTVKKNKKFYISATQNDDKWLFILTNHLYFLYKLAKRIQQYYLNVFRKK